VNGRWWLVFGWALVACGEETAGFARVAASGYFEPERVDFGTQGLGATHNRELLFTNASGDELLVTDVSFDPPLDAYAARLADGATLKGARLARGEERMVRVIFGPSEERRYDTTMLVTSESLQIALPIMGAGRLIPPATLALTPSSITFTDPIEVGREVQQNLRMQNVGELSGRLVRIEASAGVRVVNRDGTPASPSVEMAPNDSVDLSLYYRPLSEGALSPIVRFHTDADVITELPIRGDAVRAGALSCDTNRIDFGPVTRGSTIRTSIRCDVTGGAYTLASVSLVPTAEGMAIENASAGPDARLTQLTFDVSFRANGLPRAVSSSVEILAAAGQRVSIPINTSVVPPPVGQAALTLTLSWTAPNTDIDLHLVRAGNNPFAAPHDCHFGAKTLDWNLIGDDRDDPFLDQDDTLGPGTEQITMLDGGSGSYEVWVQYYAHPAGAPNAVDVELSYQLTGGAMGLRTRTLNTCGNMWHVGTIRFDQQPPTFTAADTETNVYASETDRCL
jgi:hypothetical protein